MIRPFFTGNNPLYKEEPYKSLWDRISQPLIEFLEGLKPNRENSDAFACDDMILWFRNLGFLDDPEFQKACEGFESSSFIRAKLYRVYTYCWAVRQSQLTVQGNAIDLGTYDGKTVQIANRYHAPRHWYLFDAFDHHPSQPDKGKHGPALIDEVRQRIPNATVIPGLLPDTLPEFPEHVTFLHVDLNNPEIELECVRRIVPQMQRGVVLIDDYGWKKYHRTYELMKEYLGNVYENPTGQGVFIV